MPGTEGLPPQEGAQKIQARGLIPPEVIGLIVPPLKVGTWCGGAGASIGVVAAILKDASPWMSAVMTGTQWATLGTTYWFSRIIALRALVGEKDPTAFDKIKASTAAGIPTGAMLSLSLRQTRGNRTLGRSIIFCSLTALGGQSLVNLTTGRSKTPEAELEEGHWLGGRYSPLKQLSDEEYIHKIDEKILRVDADIALIDERIARLKEQEQQAPSQPKP